MVEPAPGEAADSSHPVPGTTALAALRRGTVHSLLVARRAVARQLASASAAAFDRVMGVSTRGVACNEAELAPLSVGGDPRRYEGFLLLLWWRWNATIRIDRKKATFVDLGAGLGRAVILAAEAGFRRVVGVELDDRLAQEAEHNLRRWHAKRAKALRPGQEVVVMRGDAANYQFPEGPLVVLMYNPFGATTMQHVLRRVCDPSRAQADPVYVAYVNPIHRAVFDEFPRLQPHASAKRWIVYRLEEAPSDRPAVSQA